MASFPAPPIVVRAARKRRSNRVLLPRTRAQFLKNFGKATSKRKVFYGPLVLSVALERRADRRLVPKTRVQLTKKFGKSTSKPRVVGPKVLLSASRLLRRKVTHSFFVKRAAARKRFPHEIQVLSLAVFAKAKASRIKKPRAFFTARQWMTGTGPPPVTTVLPGGPRVVSQVRLDRTRLRRTQPSGAQFITTFGKSSIPHIYGPQVVRAAVQGRRAEKLQRRAKAQFTHVFGKKTAKPRVHGPLVVHALSRIKRRTAHVILGKPSVTKVQVSAHAKPVQVISDAAIEKAHLLRRQLRTHVSVPHVFGRPQRAVQPVQVVSAAIEKAHIARRLARGHVSVPHVSGKPTKPVRPHGPEISFNAAVENTRDIHRRHRGHVLTTRVFGKPTASVKPHAARVLSRTSSERARQVQHLVHGHVKMTQPVPAALVKSYKFFYIQRMV